MQIIKRLAETRKLFDSCMMIVVFADSGNPDLGRDLFKKQRKRKSKRQVRRPRPRLQLRG